MSTTIHCDWCGEEITPAADLDAWSPHAIRFEAISGYNSETLDLHRPCYKELRDHAANRLNAQLDLS